MNQSFRFHAANIDETQRNQSESPPGKYTNKKMIFYSHKKPEEEKKKIPPQEYPQLIVVKGPVYTSSERLKKIVEDAQRNKRIVKINWGAIQTD